MSFLRAFVWSETQISSFSIWTRLVKSITYDDDCYTGVPHQGTLDGVMVSKLDKQSFMSELECHWMPHLYGLVSNLS